MFFFISIVYGFFLYQGTFALEYDYGKAEKYTVPLREHSVIVTKEGYYPKNISVFEGEKIRFYLTSTLKEPSCLLIQEKNLFLPAEKGKISEGEVFFKRPGKFKFYCPSGNIKGQITVLQKITEEKKIKREIASKRPKPVWRPREE
ncbi:MAG: hypothetical protein HN509_16670 [Halobacteriovoraceae bacterium]|jgi:hypothetical protein|nr:hypothetical protein [Halobacteriovoraceae bacterium]